MKPDPIFRYIRADEVAECWAGVPMELYARLWNVIVPLQKEIPQEILEDSGPADHVGHECLASHWHLLEEKEQVLLNNLAKEKMGE